MNQELQELKKAKGTAFLYRKDLEQEEEQKKLLQRQSLLTIF